MSYFNQFIQYRALKFKFSSMGSYSISDMERMVDNGTLLQSDDGVTVRRATLEEMSPVALRNVCAKLSVDLVERLDKTLEVLGITKRDFIEMALVEALNQVDQHLLDVDAFEYIEAKQAAAEGADHE